MRFSVVTVVLALFLLSGFGTLLVSSSPIPQQDNSTEPPELAGTNSLADDDNEIDSNGPEPKLPPSVENSDVDRTLKYSHGHGIVTNPLLESSLVSYNVNQHNVLHNLAKGPSDCPSLSNGHQQLTITSSITSSPTLLGETSVPVEFSTADQGGLDLTVNDLLSQLHTNIGLVATDGLIENFNSYTDVVIVDPPKPPVEAVEAEEEIVPAPPVVSNIFITSSSDSSSSTSSSSGDSLSSGGVIGGSVSSTSIANPLALLFTFALVVAGIFVLSLPIWVPFVVAKRRRTFGPLRKKTYPASKKKKGTKTKGNSALSYRRRPNEVKLPYGNYNAGPAMSQPEYYSMTIEDYYRPGGNPNYLYNRELNVKPYSALFGSLFPSYSNKVFNDPGPIKSKDLYGPLSNFFLKARRRNSNKTHSGRRSANFFM